MAPLKPGGAEQWLSYATRHEWCDLVEELRRCECASQLAAVRRGLAAVVPAAALAIFTAAELERMCCGEADWSVAFLQTNSEVTLPLLTTIYLARLTLRMTYYAEVKLP